MNILVINDDGIDARGILELTDALSTIKDAVLYIVSPDRQRSATSRSMTIRGELVLERQSGETFPGVKEVYSCSGTPADCAKIGLSLLRKRGIEADMICSGINLGMNLGVDTHYSGTVGAALEGSIRGIPSIAFSLNDREPEHFGALKTLIPKLVLQCRNLSMPTIMLNVNCPNLPQKEIKGIKICGIKGRRYREVYKLKESEGNRHVYDVSAEPIEDWIGIPGDVSYNYEGWITISPMDSDNNTKHMMAELEGWDLKI